jgi:hypothetical protein
MANSAVLCSAVAPLVNDTVRGWDRSLSELWMVISTTDVVNNVLCMEFTASNLCIYLFIIS